MRTPGGRRYSAVGDVSLLTLDRLPAIEARLDSDPRIASISITATSDRTNQSSFIRAAAPTGPATVIALDLCDLVGEIDPGSASADDVATWCEAASDRGLWHDWLLIDSADVRRAEDFIPLSPIDAREARDATSSRSGWTAKHHRPGDPLTVTVDVAWLGPYETGAQVLTTAALGALARNPKIESITLVGATGLPEYAQHLIAESSIRLIDDPDAATRSDIVWFPNQIDQRSNIALARTLGERIVTTYLDLIAYDIPRYHAGLDAWAEYRQLQRSVALSVDGITTISADVASRLLQEVPSLDPERVRPIPLGLDHIVQEKTPDEAPSEIADAVSRYPAKPFVLVLGNDFVHKNRDFAIKVWERVLDRGISCDLILAGLHVRSSSSKQAEARLKSQHTNLRGTIHTLGHLSTESRNWLLEHASAVIYPSSAEGFGFVPYEAAMLGTPTTFVDFGPLKELTTVSDAPSQWSLDHVSEDLLRNLTDPAFSLRRITQLTDAAHARSWSDLAEELVDFFSLTLTRPRANPLASNGESASVGNSTRVSASKKLRGAVRKLGALRKR